MPSRPVVLNFSGNDSAGFAGLAADLRVQSAMGVHSASVITANTAQNNQQFLSVNPVLDEEFITQLKANSVLPIEVIKVGLLADYRQVELIAEFVKQNHLPVVLDPVLSSTSGASLASSEIIDVLKHQLFPYCRLLSPNIPEAELLTGIEIRSQDDMVKAADSLLSCGAAAVVVKGGHFESDLAQDYFSDGEKAFWLTNKKINTNNTRGTGCVFSSAVASSIALGYSLYDAVVIAKMAVSQGLRESYSINGDKGPVNATCFPNQQMDLPVLTQTSEVNVLDSAFPECNQPVLGLYPVIDRAKWLTDLAPAGVSCIQLRVKDLEGVELENEIKQAVKLSEQLQVRLFINDYWQLAIKHGAYGVHLGQEDLDVADIEQIKKAGLRLGLSTHCHYEVARAHAYQPSYIACGPVYHTTTKDMPWVPHGIDGLSYWRKVLGYPLVAIGGINCERFDKVAKVGVDSIAMITAITLADSPVDTAKNFVKRLQENAVEGQ